MPTYEYKCDACGFAFEKYQSITAPAIKKCPQCKKNRVKRLIGTGSAMIFKGGGFYITDYRSESYKDAAKADTAPAGDSASADKKSGDAKASTDAPAKPSADAKPAATDSKKSEPAKPPSTSKSEKASPSKESKKSRN